MTQHIHDLILLKQLENPSPKPIEKRRQRTQINGLSVGFKRVQDARRERVRQVERDERGGAGALADCEHFA